MQQQGYSSSSPRASSSVHSSLTQHSTAPVGRVLAVTHRSGVYGETRRVNPSARVLSSSPSATGMNTIYLFPTGVIVPRFMVVRVQRKNAKRYHRERQKNKQKQKTTRTTTTTAT